MGTIGYKKLMTDNSIRIMMNDIDYSQFYFLGPMDKCSYILDLFFTKGFVNKLLPHQKNCVCVTMVQIKDGTQQL
jgi:hypothetical protein